MRNTDRNVLATIKSHAKATSENAGVLVVTIDRLEQRKHAGVRESLLQQQDMIGETRRQLAKLTRREPNSGAAGPAS